MLTIIAVIEVQLLVTVRSAYGPTAMTIEHHCFPLSLFVYLP